jgi:hypothetical protein
MDTWKKKILVLSVTTVIIFLSSCKKKEPILDSVTFEEMPTGQYGYWNGSDLSGGFTSGNIFFINHYNNSLHTWSGFAYTNHTDNTTPDVSNLYSSMSGSGADGSVKYGVFCFSGKADTMKFVIDEMITHLSVCNTAYVYYSIKNGTPVCKKFGGDSGNDQDWLKLTLTGIDSTGTVKGYVDINLSDYRYTDNSHDFIANAWLDLDMSSFGYIRMLKFEMSSSDSGPSGMNTPGYVCIDNIIGELIFARE